MTRITLFIIILVICLDAISQKVVFSNAEVKLELIIEKLDSSLYVREISITNELLSPLYIDNYGINGNTFCFLDFITVGFGSYNKSSSKPKVPLEMMLTLRRIEPNQTYKPKDFEIICDRSLSHYDDISIGVDYIKMKNLNRVKGQKIIEVDPAYYDKNSSSFYFRIEN